MLVNRRNTRVYPKAPAPTGTDLPVSLSPQENRIIFLLCEQALCTKEIAHQLEITPGTLKVYMSKIYAKLGYVLKAGGPGFGQVTLVIWYWKRKYGEATGSTDGIGIS